MRGETGATATLKKSKPDGDLSVWKGPTEKLFLKTNKCFKQVQFRVRFEWSYVRYLYYSMEQIVSYQIEMFLPVKNLLEWLCSTGMSKDETMNEVDGTTLTSFEISVTHGLSNVATLLSWGDLGLK